MSQMSEQNKSPKDEDKTIDRSADRLHYSRSQDKDEEGGRRGPGLISKGEQLKK